MGVDCMAQIGRQSVRDMCIIAVESIEVYTFLAEHEKLRMVLRMPRTGE